MGHVGRLGGWRINDPGNLAEPVVLKIKLCAEALRGEGF